MEQGKASRAAFSRQGETIIARRTESIEAPNILKLVQPSTDALFGRVNVVNLM